MRRKHTLSHDEMLEKLRCAAQEAGSQTALAKKLGISLSYLNDVLNGRRDVSKQLAEAIGYMRLEVFVPETTE